MDIFPQRPDAERLLEFATKMALEYIPKLGIPPGHQESALKAYVAGFFAGNGARAGEAASENRESN